jgi:hypothetical protein
LAASPSTQPACEPNRWGKAAVHLATRPARRSAIQPFRG